MRFSRDVTGIPVIQAGSGKELGRVSEWLLDKKGESITAFVAEGVGWLPQKKVFSFKQVAGMSDDAVLVIFDEKEAAADDQISEEETRSVIGKRVLTESGEEVGVIEDLLFEEDTGRIAGWRLSSGLIEDLLSGRQVLEYEAPLIMDEEVLVIRD